MERLDFIKKSLLGTGILMTAPTLANLVKNDIDELSQLEPIGFNHLPTHSSELFSKWGNNALQPLSIMTREFKTSE